MTIIVFVEIIIASRYIIIPLKISYQTDFWYWILVVSGVWKGIIGIAIYTMHYTTVTHPKKRRNNQISRKKNIFSPLFVWKRRKTDKSNHLVLLLTWEWYQCPLWHHTGLISRTSRFRVYFVKSLKKKNLERGFIRPARWGTRCPFHPLSPLSPPSGASDYCHP